MNLELGLRNWQFSEVLAGLAPGDRVVRSFDKPGDPGRGAGPRQRENPEAPEAAKP